MWGNIFGYRLFLLSMLLYFGMASSLAWSDSEKSRVIDGTINIEIEDYPGYSQLKYWLRDALGKHTEILLSQQPSWLKTGQRVRVHGNQHGGKLAVTDDSIDLLQSPEPVDSAVSTQSSMETVSGDRSVLIAEVNFSVNPLVQYSISQIHEQVLIQSNLFFQETSYGEMSLSGHVSPPITVDVDVSTCNTSTITEQADRMLRERGYEPDAYNHVMYLIPTHPNCTWSGKANVNGPRTWIKRFEPGTINHELGHNIGLYHSNKKDCGSVTADGANCSVVEYGDYLSAMSSTITTKHFNSFHKEQLGWLTGRVATLTASGTVILSALETGDIFAPKTLKIPKGVDSGNNNEWYYIEYRQAQGFDSALASEAPGYLSGVRLREGTDNQPNSSYLLDPTPNSTSYDWDDISLDPGQTYYDSTNNITISVLSSDSDQVVLEVQLATSIDECTHQAASFESLSNSTVTSSADKIVIFTYRLVNNDSQNCTATNFDLSTVLSNGLSGGLDISMLNLSPGESQTFDLNVAIPPSALSGDYDVDTSFFRPVDSQTQNHLSTITVFDTSINQAPVAVNDEVTVSSKNSSILIPVLDNDFDPEESSLAITSITQGKKGSATLNADGTILYVPGKAFKSFDSFSYTITDGALSSTAIVRVELKYTGDSGGDKGKGRKKP